MAKANKLYGGQRRTSKGVEKRRAWGRDHYRRNKLYYQNNNRKRFKENREIINAAKSNPCVDCLGEFPPCVMDFDHVRGKKLFRIAEGTSKGLPQLLAEIAKCDLVCANCHRIRTQTRIEKKHGA